jgi:predicted NodU family carbamoyl transferase
MHEYHGDAAAAIVTDRPLIAAAEEEHFNCKKHCAGFPALVIRHCLEVARISFDQAGHVRIFRDSSAHDIARKPAGGWKPK